MIPFLLLTGLWARRCGEGEGGPSFPSEERNRVPPSEGGGVGGPPFKSWIVRTHFSRLGASEACVCVCVWCVWACGVGVIHVCILTRTCSR